MISYKFKLYKNKKNKYLELLFQEACFVWNRFLAIQRKYYQLYGKYASAVQLQKHYAKRYKRTYLHSQTAQEVLQRLDMAYQRFFTHLAKRPPKFKNKQAFTSFVYKQGGYSINGNAITLNSIKKTFKFHLSREVEGNIKRVIIKRSALGEYYVVIITDHTPNQYNIQSRNGASVGIDFGLKMYLTLSDGIEVSNPQHFKRNLRKLQQASKNLSRKTKGSHNYQRAKRSLCCLHEHITNSRKDFQWKLAHSLCKRYEYIFLEDLSLVGMTRLWGRKMHDLSHSSFVNLLCYVATKYGTTVHKIDRYYASSKLCDCGYKYEQLRLTEREWVCPHCGQVHKRDVHAANNILRRGIYELESNCKTKETFVSRQLC